MPDRRQYVVLEDGSERLLCFATGGHRIRWYPAKTITAKRTAAGWPPAECSCPQGSHAVCTKCWELF